MILALLLLSLFYVFKLYRNVTMHSQITHFLKLYSVKEQNTFYYIFFFFEENRCVIEAVVKS